MTLTNISAVVRIKNYEARVFNERTRRLLETGEPNTTGFADTWADSRLVQVRALSLAEAARLLERDYPPEAGFKVTDIIELPGGDPH